MMRRQTIERNKTKGTSLWEECAPALRLADVCAGSSNDACMVDCLCSSASERGDGEDQGSAGVCWAEEGNECWDVGSDESDVVEAMVGRADRDAGSRLTQCLCGRGCRS